MNALSFVEAYADVEPSLKEYHLGVEAHKDKGYSNYIKPK